MEEWLGKVEEAMFASLRRLCKAAIGDYERRSREEWVVSHSSQVVLTISQLQWCRDLTEILDGDFDRLEAMRDFEQKSFSVSFTFYKFILFYRFYELIKFSFKFIYVWV